MTKAAILTIRPNVRREEAERLLMPVSLAGLLRRLTMGRLRAVAEVYLPFRVHEVAITNRGRKQTRFFAVDAVNGDLDLYGFDGQPEDAISVETRNRLPGRLSRERSLQIVVEKVRRAVFQNGFFRLHKISISAAPAAREIHVPYWVGLFGSEEDMKLVVIDAVRRRVEGAKVAKLIRRWLMSQE